MGIIASIFYSYIQETDRSVQQQRSVQKDKYEDTKIPNLLDTVSTSSTIKYLPDAGPASKLGPSPGNIERKNPIIGCPTIRAPTDNPNELVAESNSQYDTISMTPDVDWEKKQILPKK